MKHLALGLSLVLTISASATGSPDKGSFSTRPQADATCSLDLLIAGKSRRKIRIHEEFEQTDKTKRKSRVFFHRPLLALVTDKGQGDSQEAPWILGIRQRGDSHFVRVDFLLSTPELRRRCKELVLRTTGLKSVEVRRWPVQHLVVECRDGPSGQLLSSTELEISNEGDQLEKVWLEFTPSTHADFLASVADGDIRFRFRYSFEGRRLTTGSIADAGMLDIEASVKKHLESRKLTPSSPVFQRDVDTISRMITVEVSRRIVAQSLEVMPMLKPTDLRNRLVASESWMTIAQVRKSYPKIDDRLAAYLSTALEKVTDNSVTKNTVTETKNYEVNGSLKIPIKKVEANIGGKVDRKIVRESGVTLTVNKEKTAVLVHKIKVVKLRSGIEKMKISDKTVAVLDLGATRNYLPDGTDTDLTDRAFRVWIETRTRQCPDCSGNGFNRCKDCQGTSHVKHSRCKGVGILVGKSEYPILQFAKCIVCSGSGTHGPMGRCRHGHLRGDQYCNTNSHVIAKMRCTNCNGSKTALTNAKGTTQMLSPCDCKGGLMPCPKQGAACDYGRVWCKTCKRTGILHEKPR